MSVSHIFHLCKPALVRHCRHVPEFVGGRRGAAEPVEAAVSAGLGDGCSGLGHLEDGPELPAALHQTSPSAHAALAYKACQVQTIKTLTQVTSLTAHHSKRMACASYTVIYLKIATFIYFFAQELWMQKS